MDIYRHVRIECMDYLTARRYEHFHAWCSIAGCGAKLQARSVITGAGKRAQKFKIVGPSNVWGWPQWA